MQMLLGTYRLAGGGLDLALRGFLERWEFASLPENLDSCWGCVDCLRACHAILSYRGLPCDSLSHWGGHATPCLIGGLARLTTHTSKHPASIPPSQSFIPVAALFSNRLIARGYVFARALMTSYLGPRVSSVLPASRPTTLSLVSCVPVWGLSSFSCLRAP